MTTPSQRVLSLEGESRETQNGGRVDLLVYAAGEMQLGTAANYAEYLEGYLVLSYMGRKEVLSAVWGTGSVSPTAPS